MAERGESAMGAAAGDAREGAAGGAGSNPPAAARPDLAPDFPPGLPPEIFTPAGVFALADMLPVLTAFVDRDEIIRFVNRPYAEWMQRPRGALVGIAMRDLLGDDIYAARKPLIDAAMAGKRQLFAADFPHPTRGPLALQMDYVPWIAPGSEAAHGGATGDSATGGGAAGDAVLGMVVVIADVTEQRVAERALRESEARFRRIANSAPVMMWVTRADRSRDFVNDAYAAFIGIEQEAARAYDWRSAIHPDDAPRLVAESAAGEASGAPFALEARFRRHDGEYRWLRSMSSPRFGPDGAVNGFIGVANDVTLAKQAEEQLKALVDARTAELGVSEARFRAIFDTVLEVLVLLDPDGTVLELNRKTSHWRDPNPRQAIGRKIWESPTLARYPDQVPLLKRAVAAAAGGALFREETMLERPGTPAVHLDSSMQPVRDGDGTIIFLLFEARDITDLKAAQEQLRQAQKMEALGQLTGGIAHDFNNLLTVVVGGLDVVSKRVEDPKLKRYATNALEAAERGARLTAQLLAFSRVQRLEVKPTLVAPLIERMRPLLRNVLGPGIQKSFALDEAGMPVMADPTQLELAVLNLAINARDAMPEGGQLHFASRKVAIAGDPELADGDYIELAISDTGSGMPPEVKARAFEPFFTTKEVGRGTGLGLSMVYGVARQSGGTARIDSAPGDGTVVRLYFRRAEDEVETADAAAAPEHAQARRNASVLVIDDDPDVRGFIVTSLEDLGYVVGEASDGESGLAEFARSPPDLIVLDFVMPGLSGAEVASRILAERPDQRILFVSGYSETDAIRRIAPDAPLLAKPFRADALDGAVRGALAEPAAS